MDSGSGRDRQKKIQRSKRDNMENVKESVEKNEEQDIPKILSPELRDVFPVFASMLDIKSFMNLAMTCKDMHKRCHEDNKIKINVTEDRVLASHDYIPAVRLNPKTVAEEHIDSYVAALRKLPCKVKMRLVTFREGEKTPLSIVDAALLFMKEIGVEEIEVFMVENLRNSKDLVSFIKNFHVSSVILENNVPPNILSSLLDLEINYLSYEGGRISIDFLLERSSKIPYIALSSIRSVDKDKLLELLEKIQSGSLRHVAIGLAAVDWNNFNMLPFDHVGPLPDERPLLFTRKEKYFDEYWFLHWHGGVTKCIGGCDNTQIFKCEPWGCPWILRNKEDILKNLAEKRCKVYCSASQFQEFRSTLEKFSAPPTGDLPKERPLYFGIKKNNFLLLDEDDSLVEYEWNNGMARCERLTPFHDNRFEHPGLAKHMFWKALEKRFEFERSIYCEDAATFNSWFKDYEKLPFDYSGALPKTSPVVFERISSEDGTLRVVLFGDHLLQCQLKRRKVKINDCTLWNVPDVLITADDVKKILQRTSDRFRRFVKGYAPKDVNKRLAHETFCEGFELFKTAPFDPKKRPIVHEKTTKNADGATTEERWYFNDGAVRKATWKEGKFTVCHVTDYLDSPVEFIQQTFRIVAEMKCDADTMFLNLKQFRSCLEQFTVVPFDYSGPLKTNSPMAFVKKENQVWFLWDGMQATYCTWEEGEVESKKLDFQTSSACDEIPPALTTKEHLKKLIQGIFKEELYMWHGLYKDFRGLLKEFKTLPFDYDGPLPKNRPLLFERFGGCFILRQDGIVIRGRFCGGERGNALLALPCMAETLPPALEFLPTIVFGQGCI